MYIKPDLVMVWPVQVDYPIFRHYLQSSRDLFNKVLICFSDEYATNNISHWVSMALEHFEVEFLESPPRIIDRDWRDYAMKDVWKNITSEWTLFTEPDFIHQGAPFYESVFLNREDAIAYKEGDRIHPAFLLVRSEDVFQTSKDVSALAGEYDHFGKLVSELLERCKIEILASNSHKQESEFLHMRGLTHNYERFEKGLEPVGEADFTAYIRMCERVSPQCSPFQETHQEILSKYSSREPSLIYQLLSNL